jgi:hypothetical protein
MELTGLTLVLSKVPQEIRVTQAIKVLKATKAMRVQ